MKKIGFLISCLLLAITTFAQTYRPNNVPVEFNRAVRYTADISPTSLSASQNNYDPAGLTGIPDTAVVIRLTSSAAINLTGLAGGSDGRIIKLINIGSFPITLKNESSSSTAANRFALVGDITLQAKDVVDILYDPTSSRWRAEDNRVPGEELIGKLLSANLNVTTDQTINIYNASKYVISKIVVTNASANLSAGSTAGGFYPSASKGGTAIVANTQVYTALSASTKYQNLTLAAVAGTDVYTGSAIYFSLTTAFGSACTADIYVYGYVLEQ